MAQGRLASPTQQGNAGSLFSSSHFPNHSDRAASRDRGRAPTEDSAPGAVDRSLMDGFAGRRSAQATLSATQQRLAQRFVEALFEDASARCIAMIDAVLDECGDPQQVVVVLFNPAAVILERKWLDDECDFLQMTIVVSRMQRLFRQMVAAHPPTARPDVTRCALLVQAPGDQHSLGLVIIDDALTRAGWSVDCASASGRTDMFRLAGSNDYRIIGISVGGVHALRGLASVLDRLRRKSLNASVLLMAGGNQAIVDPRSVLSVGFDVIATDATSAVRLAESTVSSCLGRASRAVAAE